MSNAFLPEWPEANYVLDPFIDKYFNIYVSTPSLGVVYVTFLPEEQFSSLIPNEAFEKVEEMVKAFTKYMEYILDKHGVLESIDDLVDINKVAEEIKNKFENFLEFYKAQYGNDLKDVLKHFLGCPVILKDNI